MKRKRGRPKKIVHTDEILDKILQSEPEKPIESEKTPETVTAMAVDTTITVIPGHNIKEQLLTMRRHFKGGLMAVERLLQPFTAKCQKCYETYGFLDKCDCNVDLEEKS